MTDPLRLGIVGLGSVARLVYLPLLARNADLFTIAAVCDARAGHAARTAEALGVEHATSDAGELLATDDLDAVLLLSSGSHGALAAAAQRAGLAVLCEKPLAYTLAETEELTDSTPLQLGYMKLYDPAVTEALRHLPELGTLRSIEVLVLHPSMDRQLRHLPPSPPAPPPAALVRQQQELAAVALGEAAAASLGPLYTGVALGSIVHELSVIRVLGGPLTTIDHADAWPTDVDPPSVGVLGTTDAGIPVSIRWHYLAEQPTYFEEIRVHGARGSLTLRFPTPYVLHAQAGLSVALAGDTGEEITRFSAFDEAFELQLQAFHDVCHGEAAPRAGIAEGRADIATCQQIVRRIAERRGVTVEGEATS